MCNKFNKLEMITFKMHPVGGNPTVSHENVLPAGEFI